nr:alpha/beta hydrolase [Bacillus subtilis]
MPFSFAIFHTNKAQDIMKDHHTIKHWYTPCKIAPDAARQAPTMKPMRTRGRRKSITIFSWTG